MAGQKQLGRSQLKQSLRKRACRHWMQRNMNNDAGFRWLLQTNVQSAGAMQSGKYTVDGCCPCIHQIVEAGAAAAAGILRVGMAVV